MHARLNIERRAGALRISHGTQTFKKIGCRFFRTRWQTLRECRTGMTAQMAEIPRTFGNFRLKFAIEARAPLERSMLRQMRLADLVQYFRQPAVVARLVEKVGRAERDRRILVFGQIVVGEHDDPRFLLRARQRAHHAEARTLLQMQIEDDHVDRIALDGGQRRRLTVRRSDQFHIGYLPDRLGQSLGQNLRVLDQLYPQRAHH